MSAAEIPAQFVRNNYRNTTLGHFPGITTNWATLLLVCNCSLKRGAFRKKIIGKLLQFGCLLGF
jgi:hypothetical protein